MEIRASNKCTKMMMPNGKVVDILGPVLDEIAKWVQDENEKPESGGYIIGYLHNKTGNVTLERVSPPYFLDIKRRVRFEIRDPRHNLFLMKAKREKSYYMGVWHTHPQNVPSPSGIDWNDWNATLRQDRTGCNYVFFIIAGTKEWKLWIGNRITKKIVQAQECKKDAQGMYKEEENRGK